MHAMTRNVDVHDAGGSFSIFLIDILQGRARSLHSLHTWFFFLIFWDVFVRMLNGNVSLVDNSDNDYVQTDESVIFFVPNWRAFSFEFSFVSAQRIISI